MFYRIADFVIEVNFYALIIQNLFHRSLLS